MLDLTSESQQQNLGLTSTPPYNNQLSGDSPDQITPSNHPPLLGNTSDQIQLENFTSNHTSLNPSLQEVINLAESQLKTFASNSQVDKLLGIAFGVNYNPQVADSLLNNIANGNDLPHIQVISSDILGTANGAYASKLNTIFLSDKFVQSHNAQEVAGVLIEEIGHYIDNKINTVDSAGDEGDIFSRLVQGKTLNSFDLALLKQEDDSSFINYNGQLLSIEQALPTVSLTVFDASAGETNTGVTVNPGAFKITRTDTTTATTVYYTISGTATNGIDYTTSGNVSGSNYVLMGVGVSSATLGINVINDLTFEGTESVTLTLNTNSLYALGTTKTGTINILDNDLPTVTIAANDSSAGEIPTGQTQNPGQFTLTRTGNTASALTAYYTASGTATKGIDYSSLIGSVTFAAGSATALINLNVTDDTVIENNETVVLTLSANTAYAIGATNNATVTITDNDKNTINITANDNIAGETVTGLTKNPGQFTVTRTGNISSALTASYTVGGTATNGVDYSSLTGSVTFAAGSNTALINLNVTDDSLIEGNENVVLTLNTNTGYNIGSNNSATVTLTDNDQPTITISANDNSSGEIVTGLTQNPGQFTLTRTGSTANALTAYYAISGTAINGTDYNSLTGNVTFAAGSATALINLNVIDDAEFEGSENVVLTLNTNNSYIVGSASSATVTIADNDKPTITILANDNNAREVIAGQAQNSGQFTVTRTGNTANALTVNYGISGTATNGTDYSNLTGSVTFAAGSNTALINLNTINDSVVEGNETVVLNLSSNTAYNLGSANSATVTIVDNDTSSTDINGDGKGDIVGFRQDNVWSSLSNGNGTFGGAIYGIDDFDEYHGWITFNDQPRMLADVNGDGKADIVGFRQDAVWVSLSNGNGTFGGAIYALNDFNEAFGWHNFNDQPRTLADVNGDGKADIVGFRQDAVWVSLSNGNGTFGGAIYALNDFNEAFGWHNFNDQPRTLADVNGDGKADIVGFRQDGVWVSLSNGDGTFGQAMYAIDDFNAKYGWNSFNEQPRMLADVNGDGKADIVGFREDQVWVSLSNGNGTFAQANPAIDDFNEKYGWMNFNNQPRMLTDVNGDGKADIIGFREDNVWVSLSNGNGTFAQANPAINDFDEEHGWHTVNMQPLMAGMGGYAPDLIIQNQSAPSSANVGSNITIGANTTNIGSGASGASHVRYWLSDDTTLDGSDIWLGENYVNGLNAGASEYDSLTFNYNSAWGTGNKYILFQADGFNAVWDENNEWNNIAYQAISISSSDTTTIEKANSFFKQQFYSATYNPDGPSSSSNCGPASLAMIIKALGLEPSGISVETSIDHARYLMYPNDSRVTTRQGVKVLDTDQAYGTDIGIQEGIKNAGGTATKSSTWDALDQNLINGKPMVARGNISTSWKNQFPSSFRYGNGGDDHYIAILGKTSDGKYIIADPMYTGGCVAMTKDQLSVFFQSSGPVTISFSKN